MPRGSTSSLDGVTEPFAAWIERDLVHLSGPDTIEYLQGQLSQDIAALGIGESAWTLLLQPAGKVISWLRVTRVGESEVVLDGDAGSGETTAGRLARFLLRTKLDISVEPSVPVLAVRGAAMPGPGAALPICWPATAGYDQIGASARVPVGLATGDRAQYELARIEAGVPMFGRELTESTIPAEAGQWLIDASVSFTKGCYTGQELVARVDSRGGNVPRPIRRLQIDGRDIETGAEVFSDGAPVGQVTSAAWSQERGATIALAPLARAVTPSMQVTVSGAPARVLE